MVDVVGSRLGRNAGWCGGGVWAVSTVSEREGSVNLQRSLVGMWLTKLTAVSTNWHRYLAIAGLVKI